ncbi:single-stranded DNA-binding protein [Cyclobacterium marinum]|uniref:Single-stranded DNA-binding protein n=1 Tax=Cyclobacterium marinum (strain ATCC 25205 / DSM 745 / LMG 13164 / NCIMB 1802) TaxID=880070 RepID=G0J0R1_CYCMS|nr:single-stranded DNA-binding protein [Cyclobacterium marinum]AEL24473.1 single-strand binding protein [Cyclobacterium marinum DSM 745]MBI0399134.1 single-stranded DNA-binding protein [Cyclobacterium marinum]MBR9775828.1 single-stranded DNA-binding protein [Cytophagales bacterium]|tara:strand:- start:15914 stop:16258 length:345 start_codon:yes stop_codon:yes gene_type:complete
MNSIRNNVQLIGRLGAKADYKTVKGDTPMVKLNLATNEFYKNNKGEKVEETYWHNLVAFGKTAEIINKYTDKGSEICIQGKLVNRSYEDKDGQKKYITEVQINDVLLMGDKSKA